MRSYTAARREARQEPVEFEYAYVEKVPATDDEPAREVERVEIFACRGEVSGLLLSELAYNADVDAATVEGMGMLREFFSQAFGDPIEYRRFFKLHTGYGDDDLLVEIMGDLVEDFSARPTQRPSSSPASPSASGPVSKVVSLQRGTVAPVVDLDREAQIRDSLG